VIKCRWMERRHSAFPEKTKVELKRRELVRRDERGGGWPTHNLLFRLTNDQKRAKKGGCGKEEETPKERVRLEGTLPLPCSMPKPSFLGKK